VRQYLLLSGLFLGACGFFDGGNPLVEAHRGGAAYFPRDSASAIRNVVAQGFPGVELDVVLTADEVPVLSHDQWLDQTLCTYADGRPLPQGKAARIFVRDVTLDELRSGFVCGGVRDETEPDAELVAEPIMTFDELIAEVRQAPSMVVHIDDKYEPGMTAGPERLAEQILGHWRAAAPPNPWYVSADLPEAIAALEARGPVETSLGWPHVPADEQDQQYLIGLKAELGGLTGLDTLASLARDAGADGVAIAYQLADRAQIEVARHAGLKVRLWTLDSKKLLETYCRWPVDSVITDMPKAAPCL
jgi:glycerophosphoryl diester phosphodiesterase